MKISGIVLAGGESRRFGTPKAFAVHKEKYFYENTCEVLQPFVDDLLIVTRPELQDRFRRYQIIVDDSAFQGMGPLVGLYSAMIALPSDWYCVLACDMPLMEEETVRRLVEVGSKATEYDAVVPRIEGRVQPLAAMYHRSTLKILRSLLIHGNRKVRTFLDEIRVHYLDDKDFVPYTSSFTNVNSREDLVRLQEEEEL